MKNLAMLTIFLIGTTQVLADTPYGHPSDLSDNYDVAPWYSGLVVFGIIMLFALFDKDNKK